MEKQNKKILLCLKNSSISNKMKSSKLFEMTKLTMKEFNERIMILQKNGCIHRENNDHKKIGSPQTMEEYTKQDGHSYCLTELGKEKISNYEKFRVHIMPLIIFGIVISTLIFTVVDL